MLSLGCGGVHSEWTGKGFVNGDDSPEGRHFNVPLVTMILSKDSALGLA